MSQSDAEDHPRDSGVSALIADDVSVASQDESDEDAQSGAQTGRVDSSDEDVDEDDDEEAARKVAEGFIVDDEDEDEDTAAVSKKRRRKRKAVVDEELDEDDLDLLRENAGELPTSKDSSKLKRLKRGGDSESDPSKGLGDIFSDEEGDDNTNNSPGVKHNVSDDELSDNAGDGNDVDGDEDDDLMEASRQRQANQQQQQQQGGIGEFDDFIEDDEFSEDDEDRDERLAKMRSAARAKQTQFSQQSKIDQDKLDELYEIFGDGEEYAWALAAEEVEQEERDREDEMYDINEQQFDEDGNLISEPKSESKALRNIFEYEELKEHLLTDKDQEIRITDIPERYQILRESVENYYLNDEEFAQKQKWVAEILLKENSSEFEDKSHLLEPFKESVAKIVEFISRDNLEVPTIWNSRKDYTLYTTTNENDTVIAEKILNENDLWRIVQLDIEYHTLLEKKMTVQSLFESLAVVDLTYEESISNAKTLAELQDIYEYLNFTYSSEIKKIQSDNSQPGVDKQKYHSKYTFFEKVRKDALFKNVVELFGIDAENFGENVSAGAKIYPTNDADKSPFDLVKDVIPDSYFTNVDAASNAAKQIYTEMLVHNPKLRSHLRSNFQQYSSIDIELTEKGRSKINDASPYADFKYAINRNAEAFLLKPDMFLRMLEAESLGYVNIKIGLKGAFNDLVEHLFTLLASNGTSDIAQAWNKVRRECLDAAITKLVPSIVTAVKENLKQVSEKLMFFEIRNAFMTKVDQAPYIPFSQSVGTVPRVLALSNGEGQKDSAVIGIAMQFDGTIFEHIKFDETYREVEFEKKLLALIDRFKPEVIAISGYNVQIHTLKKRIDEIVKNNHKMVNFESSNEGEEYEVELPVIYVPNETARLFEYSDRAEEEFSDKPVVAKFCIGIARYVQSPLLEYIALGDAVTSISIHKHQTLLPEHTLLEAIKSILVDVSSMVGIKINDAVRSPYLALSLPYISGLGPRKASSLIKGIEANGGFLVKRADLIHKELTSKNIFMNAAPFLEIPAGDHYDKNNDLLDSTRIHPEDYDLAIKMAGDALDLEEEDRQEAENEDGGIIGKLYDEGVEKLEELAIESYAKQLEEHGHRKRTTLQMIQEELESNYEELRKSFHLLTEIEVFEMLTAETLETFGRGILVPVIIQRVDSRFMLCITQSGVMGNISRSNALPYGDSSNLLVKYTNGQAVQAVIKSVEYPEFKGEFSLLKEDIAKAKSTKKGERVAEFWNFEMENSDIRREKALELEESKGTKRILKHPYFRNFDQKQAEEYLASRDNGEFIIRPSSKGNDHLTVSWKVDHQLFQHLDVVEHDKPNEYSLGRVLQVGEFRYHDLDELIVSHINELHSKVESMKSHEKFKVEPVTETKDWLLRYSMANKNRSTYCFCFNRKAPGWFFLLFKLNDNTDKIYTWNVKVMPNGYMLHDNTYPDMVHLCNGFKTLLQNQLQRKTSAHNGGYNGHQNSHQNGYNGGYGGRF